MSCAAMHSFWNFENPKNTFCNLRQTLPNIARGTTHPEFWVYNLNYLFDWTRFVFISAAEIIQVIDSILWVRCASGNVFCLQMWPPDGTSCISCRFGQKLALLELVTSLATKWCHLHYYQFWPPGGATCIATLSRIALLTSSVAILISQSHIS